MNLALEHLRSCTSVAALRSALHALCAPYGTVVRLGILPAVQNGRHQALCFLRMASDEEEQDAIAQLGMDRFGGNLVLVVDLDEPWRDAGFHAWSADPLSPPIKEPRNAQHPHHLGHAS